MARKKWESGNVERTFQEISDKEMIERLAEVLQILLKGKSQLSLNTAFSLNSQFSKNFGPQPKRGKAV